MFLKQGAIWNFLLVILLNFLEYSKTLEIIFAINSGGEAHIDSNNINYRRDPLHGKVGTASDYGKQLIIGRVPKGDQILYQTERYHHSTFGYEIPVNRDGDYVLVLKFSEVYFNSPGMKVFDVILNQKHKIVTNLDIFGKVGRGVAHDEYIPFRVQGSLLHVIGEDSTHDGKIKVEFMKGYRDNPKINAIYVMKGTLDDVPQLPPIAQQQELEEDEEENNPAKKPSPAPIRHPSGPRLPNPYESDESSMIPIFVAIGAFIPVLFCLCKL